MKRTWTVAIALTCACNSSPNTATSEPGTSTAATTQSAVSGSGSTSVPSTSTSAASETSETDTDTGSDAPGLFERGLILPPLSLPCTPVSTGVPQNECNHHGSSVVQLPDGRIAAVWYHGEAEKSLDSNIIWSTYDQGEWSAPEVLFDDPDRAEGNPAIWVSPTGELLVFFVSIYGEGWPDTKVRLVRSDDLGQTWSDPTLLRDDLCWNTRQKPVLTSAGELILPLYIECLALPTFMYSNDEFRQDIRWVEFADLPDSNGYFGNHLGQIQPSLIELEDGRLAAITRNGGLDGHIKRMVGDASGMIWEASATIDLPNSGTSVDQLKLANGNVIVIFNNSPEQRFPLAAALSYDDGETFEAVRHLNDECDRDSCSYPYPSLTQAADGTVWATYTHNRETIGWVHFDEQWLAHGGDDPVLP